ncbi:MAG TPA: lysophospholipase [Microscillaceae bacterium]|jgi:alpha-beta hydrolase superfamily lysophospholipase|nr:lysophospholipase [Microscillaceae bacterium]
MKHETFTWQGFENTPIFGQKWLPEAPQAVFVIVHGMGEHSGRFMRIVNHLVPKSYAVLAYDQRGHGQTAGKRGHTPSYQHLLEDLNLFLDYDRQAFPGIPIFLYGHSMGANVVLNFALQHSGKTKLAGVVASSPWLKLAFEPPTIQVALGKLVSRLFPAFTQNTNLDATAISQDLAAVEAYRNDPLVHDKISATFFLQTYAAGQKALAEAANLTLPLLIYHGTADRLTSPEGSKQFAQKANPQHTTSQWFEGAFHELHNETETFYRPALQLLDSWLSKQMAAIQ